MGRQSVEHLTPWSRRRRARYNAVRLQLSKVLAKHIRSYTRHGPMQLAKSVASLVEAAIDHWFPAPLDHLHRRVDRTDFTFSIARGSTIHGVKLYATGHFEVPNCGPIERPINCVDDETRRGQNGTFIAAIRSETGCASSPGKPFSERIGWKRRHRAGVKEIALALPGFARDERDFVVGPS